MITPACILYDSQFSMITPACMSLVNNTINTKVLKTLHIAYIFYLNFLFPYIEDKNEVRYTVYKFTWPAEITRKMASFMTEA